MIIFAFVALSNAKNGRALTVFAMFYSIGSIGMVMSTVFLVGFKQQMKNLWNPKRWLVVAVFFLNAIASILVALFIHHRIKNLLLLILVLTQIFAFFWYSLSYIPYGRKLLKKSGSYLLFDQGDN